MAEFRFQPPRGHSGRSALALATLLVVVLFVLDMATGGSVRVGLQRVGSGVWYAVAQVRSAIFDTGYFASHRSLALDNASLREQLAASNERAAAYGVVSEENVSLRSLVHLAQTEKGITAPVVSSVLASPYGTFLLGAGSRDGVHQGSLVLTEGGFVVGRVSDVGVRTALIKEIFAGGASTDISINGTAVSAEGRGGGNARAALPRGIAVKAGDPVIAPSLGSRAVGLVGRVDADLSSASQSVYIGLPVNLAALRYVYVLTQ